MRMVATQPLLARRQRFCLKRCAPKGQSFPMNPERRQLGLRGSVALPVHFILMLLGSSIGLGGWGGTVGAAAEEDPRAAAAGLVQRLLPRHASRFVLEVIPPDPAGDVFEIESRQGKIILRGNNGVSMASALNWYLKYHCQCHHSVTGGSQLRLPEPLPEVAPKVRRVSSARYRYFLNYCCFGYSLPWYDWPQWEQLIDWMALNGVNLPLSVTGQEAVWQAVGKRLGWNEAGMREFLAGPPYLPFGWMGCLDGHGGPLPQSWIDGHAELQRKILARQRALGMRPVLQGFTGHVPAGVTNHYPTARLQTIAGRSGRPSCWIRWTRCSPGSRPRSWRNSRSSSARIITMPPTPSSR